MCHCGSWDRWQGPNLVPLLYWQTTNLWKNTEAENQQGNGGWWTNISYSFQQNCSFTVSSAATGVFFFCLMHLFPAFVFILIPWVIQLRQIAASLESGPAQGFCLFPCHISQMSPNASSWWLHVGSPWITMWSWPPLVIKCNPCYDLDPNTSGLVLLSSFWSFLMVFGSICAWDKKTIWTSTFLMSWYIISSGFSPIITHLCTKMSWKGTEREKCNCSLITIRA